LYLIIQFTVISGLYRPTRSHSSCGRTACTHRSLFLCGRRAFWYGSQPWCGHSLTPRNALL